MFIPTWLIGIILCIIGAILFSYGENGINNDKKSKYLYSETKGELLQGYGMIIFLYGITLLGIGLYKVIF